MAYHYQERSAESYAKQLKKIQKEISNIINSMENSNEEDVYEETDKEHSTYKTEGFNNNIQLKRKRKHHTSRSEAASRLSDDNTMITNIPNDNKFTSSE